MCALNRTSPFASHCLSIALENVGGMWPKLTSVATSGPINGWDTSASFLFSLSIMNCSTRAVCVMPRKIRPTMALSHSKPDLSSSSSECIFSLNQDMCSFDHTWEVEGRAREYLSNERYQSSALIVSSNPTPHPLAVRL